jgi:hypothetical protein
MSLSRLKGCTLSPVLVAFGLALLLLSSQETPQSITKEPPAIELAPNGLNSWTATYRTFAPTTQLVFWRNSNGERTKEWTTDPDFEIVVEGNQDVLRRKDRNPFTSASVTVPARFNSHASGYPPFVPFSDTSQLIYTGQFLACPGLCPNPPTWKWSFTANVPASKHVIVDGRVRSGSISWRDSRKASLLFVGNTKLIQTRRYTAVIDPSVPGSVRKSLSANFPKFMQFFSQHLGPPAVKPTLFISHDEHYPDAGSAGANVSNDIFMHLYGPWPVDPDAGVRRVTWYFAHEAGHDFQKTDTSQSPADWWIHEGAAEEFAALALQHASPKLAAYARSRFAPALADCADGLKQASLHDALANGHHDLDYPCGLILQARFDREIRARNPMSDGIFALWRDYRERLAKGAPPATETYLASVEGLAGKRTADWARHIISDRLNDPATALMEWRR